MNERIREIAEQQGMVGPNFLVSAQELEKFAELIVSECVEKVYNHPTLFTDANYKLDDLLAYVKQHFGA